ncbi:GNAT family N-acetyltransferase [Paenibacillus sp. PAMC21692]|uniref:GNAT family N-acetyltransferase n=1 Tax=Paenibacillus sp. PAMC21692 TaxID=2762320 RepID=UPI00164DD401|nr:GNAT family N-acetyltransferase [Paenibacillus sp. PAMC21692]QNK59227.1 GNAT family N-acetyltransferase [Paenibacillus sp. PAMC21692]
MKRLAYRSVTDFEELRELSELQGTAWPMDMFTSAVQMKAAVQHGGSVIAAYEGERAAGFCYGFAAYDGKEPYLHSHMMVVHPDYRDQGAGTRLKQEQRLWAIERGYSAITWTYDPFQLRNGYLNLCKLGGTVSDYMPAVYGVDQAGDPSDRFLIRWELESPRVCAAVRGEPASDPRWPDYAKLIEKAGKPGNRLSAWDSVDGGYLLAVPRDAAEIKKRSPETIVAWKRQLRELCQEAFGRGYRIVGMLPGDAEIDYYVLEGET